MTQTVEATGAARSAQREPMSRKRSLVPRMHRRPRAIGVLRRAIAIFASLTWIAGSLVCPVPGSAHDTPASADPPSLVVPEHEHHHGHDDGHGTAEADFCCDVLGQVVAAAGPLNDPLSNLPAPDHAPLAPVVSLVVAAGVADRASSLNWHGPGPPAIPWPQFSKIRSHAPPADHT